MTRRHVIIGSVFILGVVLTFMQFFREKAVVLHPKGVVAHSQQQLIIFTVLLSLIVVIPVFVMTFYIAYTYREGNKKAAYKPEWDHSRVAETVWWGVPLILIIILSVVTFKTSHALDPFKPLASTAKPLTVQVIALQWKWLFIYPDYGVASTNYLPFPVDTPVHFDVTADAPMNSFWIPQLGGQIYAMSGMSTQLQLMADKPGVFSGSSANISGKGFSGMHFNAEAMSANNFESWVRTAQQSSSVLNAAKYQSLARPSENVKPTPYAVSDNNIFHETLMKYLAPTRKVSPNDNDSMTDGSTMYQHEAMNGAMN